jgi:AraC-like DNA-binding protein
LVAPFVFGTPAPSLGRWIERYVGYSLDGPPGIHRGLPSRHPTFIVSIGDPIDVVRHTDPWQTPDRYGIAISGLQATHALIAHEGRQEGIAFELTATGFHALFGFPVGRLWDLTLELDDVIGPVGGELWERLQGTEGWEERFDVCDRVLGRIQREAEVRKELDSAWRLLVESRGRVSVDWLAGQVGWSRQVLTRRFRDEFGLSPKLAARVIRFEHARDLLGGSDGPPIAEVAATCGYFDQAHMTRDFVELAGLPPGQLRVEEEVPFFQDDDPVPAG